MRTCLSRGGVHTYVPRFVYLVQRCSPQVYLGELCRRENIVFGVSSASYKPNVVMLGRAGAVYRHTIFIASRAHPTASRLICAIVNLARSHRRFTTGPIRVRLVGCVEHVKLLLAFDLLSLGTYLRPSCCNLRVGSIDDALANLRGILDRAVPRYHHLFGI